MTVEDAENGRGEIVVRLARATTLDAASLILADVQYLFGFRAYFVFDVLEGEHVPLAEALYLSNIPASLLSQLEAATVCYTKELFPLSSRLFTPVNWVIEDYLGQGNINLRMIELLNEAELGMGVSFPAFGGAGRAQIIGFSGSRGTLTDTEMEQLNFLMIQMHARLSLIGRGGEEEGCTLTPLERQSLTLAAEGAGIAAVAAEVGLSTRTVQYLLASVCRKMRVASIEHAVALALRRGLIV